MVLIMSENQQENGVAIVSISPGSDGEVVTRRILKQEFKEKFFDFSEIVTKGLEKLEERMEKRFVVIENRLVVIENRLVVIENGLIIVEEKLVGIEKILELILKKVS